MTPEQALARAVAVDPERLRETAADLRALAIDDLAAHVTSAEAARRLGVSPSAVAKARNRVRDQITPRRRAAAETLADQLGL